MFFVKLDGDDDLLSVYKLLEAAAQANPHVTGTELVRERYLVISTNIPDLRYAMIAPVQTEDPSKAAFDFLPLQGLFFDMAPAELYALPHGTSEDSFAVNIPYHLFGDPSLFSLSPPSSLDRTLYNTHLRHQTGRFYEIVGTMADFRAFYESLGLYEIAKDGGRLILEGSIRKRETSETDDALAGRGRMILDFKEEAGRRHVAYSFEPA